MEKRHCKRISLNVPEEIYHQFREIAERTGKTMTALFVDLVSKRSHMIDRKPFLNRVYSDLAGIYGERLKGVFLHGSEMIGNSRPDSDIDVFIVLDGKIDQMEEFRRVSNTLMTIEHEITDCRPIDAMFVSASDFATAYNSVEKEGISSTLEA